MPWNLGHSGIMDIVHEIETASPRVAVVVGVALLDESLTAALLASVRPMQRPEADKIFGDRGSVRDFSLKADLGYALNLYGPITYSDLRKMRDMRNQLAHKTRIRDFNNATIKGWCRDLKMLDNVKHVEGYKTPIDARPRFIDTVSFLSDALSHCVYMKKEGKTWSTKLP
jgi:hypothetical protein